ncbi:MAG: phage holin family protein [Prevotella sp.]|nr:phage holin family protein [Prevotella sp.]
MLSSDKNVENMAQLVEAIKEYLGYQKEFLKLDIIEKVVQLVTALTLTIVLVILGVAVLFYLSFAIVYWIEPLTGIAWAFFIVALSFLLLLALVFLFRKPWIERPLVQFLANTLLN